MQKKSFGKFSQNFSRKYLCRGRDSHNFCGKSPETRLDLFAADYLGKLLTPELIMFFYSKDVVMP